MKVLLACFREGSSPEIFELGIFIFNFFAAIVFICAVIIVVNKVCLFFK